MSIPMISIPGYIALYHSGELARRAVSLKARLSSCDLCPRECHVNRLENELGFCRSGRSAVVHTICAHHGEEPAISGSRGSGTVFFGNCNMRCLYCQNYQISQIQRGQKEREMDTRTLAGKFLYLQNELECHNINLVSPSHFVPQIVEAVLEAVPMGLRIPLVYNTSGYDSVASLKELDGIVDVYLTDLRYASDEWAGKLSQAPDYVSKARQAIKEMYRQVGNLITDEEGLAQKGVTVRLLVLPHGLSGTEESLKWLAENLSTAVTLSVMSQYSPLYKAGEEPLLSRTISEAEYERVLLIMSELGLENGWVQDMESSETYVPDFQRDSHPFECSRDLNEE